MARWLRVAAVTVLVTGVSGVGPAAEAQPEGASSSNISIDVVVRGTVPVGAQVVIETPKSQVDETTFALAEAEGTNDVFVVSGTIHRLVFVAPENDAGADRVDYECSTTGGPTEPPFTSCTGDDDGDGDFPTGHVDIYFNGNANAQANVTITFSFGTCDGLPVTTFLAAGDAPTAGPDVILGSMGPETVNGFGGDDRICGLGGSDILRGGPGIDRISGGNGADRLEGGADGDNLAGGAASDTLLGQAGNDALDGGAQRDTCNGGAQADTGVRCEVRSSIP